MAITAILAKLAAIYSNLSKVDNKTYGLKNGEFFEVPAGGIEEAPINGTAYNRKDGAWAAATGGGLTIGQIRRLNVLRG